MSISLHVNTDVFCAEAAGGVAGEAPAEGVAEDATKRKRLVAGARGRLSPLYLT